MGFYTQALIIQLVLSLISSATCFGVVIIYIWAKPLRVYAFKIIFQLNLSNLIKSLTEVVAQGYISSDSTLCLLDGYLFYSASLASFLWTLVIANKLYKSLREIPNSESDYWKIFIVVYFFSFSIGSVPFMLDEYGDEYPNCDLKFNKTAYIIRFCIYYIPAVFVIAYIGVVYSYVIKYTRKNEEYVKRDALRFWMFPVIMVLCTLPALVARIIEFCWMDVNVFDFISTCIMFLQGFFDALAYVFTPPVIQFLKKKCRKRQEHKSVSSEMHFLET